MSHNKESRPGMNIKYSQVQQSDLNPRPPQQSFEPQPPTTKHNGRMPPKANLENDPLLDYFYNMNFGRAQVYVYSLSWIVAFISAPVYVDSIFLIRNLPHRCVVPSCDDNSTQFNETFVDWAIPQGDQCHVKIRSNDTDICEEDAFTNETEKCNEWVYDTSMFTSTTVSEFDLTCDKKKLGPLAGSMYMVGMLLGAITVGDFADRFGRKLGILVSVILLGGGGVLSAVSPNYYMFLIMRLFTGAGGVGLFQVTFVLAVEFIGAKWRTFCGIIIEVPFALGEAMTGVLAIFIREWRWLQVAVTAPAFLMISYMWIMPESVRWLVSQGRKDEAVKIIKRAAKFNGAEVPKHLLEDPNLEVPTIDGTLSVASSKAELVNEEEPAPEAKRTVIDLLRTPNMRKRSFNMFYCWWVMGHKRGNRIS